MENDVSADILYNKVGGEINIREKKDFKARSITGDKGGHYLMTKWIIHPEDVVILSLHALTPSSQNTLKKKQWLAERNCQIHILFVYHPWETGLCKKGGQGENRLLLHSSQPWKSSFNC